MMRSSMESKHLVRQRVSDVRERSEGNPPPTTILKIRVGIHFRQKNTNAVSKLEF